METMHKFAAADLHAYRKATGADSLPTLNLYPWKCKKCKQPKYGTGGRKKLREGWACKDCA